MNQYTTRKCVHCGNGIEFETASIPSGETRIIECPHCQQQTAIFVSAEINPPTKPPVLFKNSQGMVFKNPANGYTERVENGTWVLVLLLGCFYFAIKGVWTHAVAGALAAILTCGLSWLVYPFFAKEIMKSHYLRKGWIQIN